MASPQAAGAGGGPLLYDIPVSNNGARNRIAIYYKGLEDKIKIVNPVELGGIKSEEYMKLNPYGKMPLFIAEGGEAIYESEVIQTYILDKFAHLGPSLTLDTAEKRARANLGIKVFDTYMQPVQGCLYRKSPSAEKRAAELAVIDENLHVLEGLCSDAGPYFCGGEPSTADCGLFPSFVFFDFMLETQFGWPDCFYDKPKLKRWYHFLKQGGGGDFSDVTCRVYKEVHGALKEWESNGRWEVQGVKEHLKDKSLKWVYP
jgi:glutathione S-transferase